MGDFVVIDGLDGIGKGVIEDALLDFDMAHSKNIFDSVKWCKENRGERPSLELVTSGNYGTVLTSEPTHSRLGLDIREELISASNGRSYSSESLIQGYSLDREIQMRRFVVPLCENGYNIKQSRSLGSTFTYQLLGSIDESEKFKEILKHILSHPGNVYQLEHRPDLVIVPTIGDVGELISRLKKRAKRDDAIFENIDFQRRLKPLYESDWFRDIFENAGSKIAYLDAGISVEFSGKQAVDIYRNFLATGNVLKGHENSNFN